MMMALQVVDELMTNGAPVAPIYGSMPLDPLDSGNSTPSALFVSHCGLPTKKM